jgi:thiosulfate/3-mercaptopyruvate sulfurtransferase
MGAYAHPEVLVETQWVEDHLNDSGVKVIESDEDILLYEQGHVPGAIKVDWVSELQDPVRRDYRDRKAFEDLCSSKGIANSDTLVFYGDKNNWWACYAFWTFKLFGHENCAIMNGGRAKWVAEKRPLTREIKKWPRSEYTVRDRDDFSIRAFRDQVLRHIYEGKPLVDVRSPGEYAGELLHMPNYPQEGALRAGHIPGAVGIPWSQACKEDGTFKSPEELRALYEGKGITRDKDVICYCRIGERSSHTWFVLKYLLGYPLVRNYDGSWTEWGNLVGVPVRNLAHEKKAGAPAAAAEAGGAAG